MVDGLLAEQTGDQALPPVPPVPSSAEVPERYSDCDRVLECMQRALKIASVCNPNLFVDILDRCIHRLSVCLDTN